MSRVLIGNLPPGTTIRNIDDFCSPFGRLLYVDVKNQGNATLACVEYDSNRNAYNLVRARHGYNFNGYTVQLKVMSGDSGPFEVGNDSRRKKLSPPPPPPSMWSSNNTSNNRGFNNIGNNIGQSSNFDNNRGSNYFPNSNSGPGSSLMGKSNLDYNQACRIVYERFINEGFNPQVAKERTLEFVGNMQGGSNQGFNNSNSDYFGQSQGMNSNNNFGNNFDNFNGNQNWSDNNYSGNQPMFPNSNWGNSNQQMSSSWGGDGGRGGGGMSYPQQRWNSGNVVNNMRNTVPRGGQPPIQSVDHERYLQSANIRKKIEAKITKGISTPRDLKNLQFHTQIMDDYERNARRQKQFVKNEPTKDELAKLQRYKSALGIVQKYKKLNQSQLSPEDRKSLARNKAIVEEYEKSVAMSKRSKAPNSAAKMTAAYERKKQQLLQESKKNYPYDFRLSGAAKKKMRSLTLAGVPATEAKLLALHSSLVVRDLINMKNGLKRTAVANGSDRSRALVPVGGKSVVAKTGGAKGKPVQAKAKTNTTAKPVDDSAGRIKDMTKKERDGMRSANRLIFKYEKNNAEIDSLTDKDIALLRMSLRRLQVYHEKYDTPIRKTKFDILLSEKYDKKEAEQKKSEGKDQATADKASEGVEGTNDTTNDAEVEEVEEGGEGEEVNDEADDEQMGEEQ